MKVVNVKTQHLMAGSGDMLSGGSQNLDNAPTTDATSGNLSKDGSSLWDDAE